MTTSPVSWQIQADKLIAYNVMYCPNIFDPSNETLLKKGNLNQRRLVFVDKNVNKIYGEFILDYFKVNSAGSRIIELDSSEISKNLESVISVIDHMEKFDLLRRSEPVVAIGGGSLLDIVGFACSIYRRGVPYIRIPTTLLSIVDVSVAIKTGVNHLGRRNRLGSYFPPSSVYLDKTFIGSQTQRDISNGMGEIFKLAVIADLDLFEILETNANLLIKEKFQFGAVPVRVINRSISIMEKHLSSNLWEENLMRVVDFGHTFSPLVELNSLPQLMHGEAVTLDCLYSSCISFLRGWLPREDLERIFNVAKELKLPTFYELFSDAEVIEASLSDTIKHRNGKQNLPIPILIGEHTFINDLTSNEIRNSSRLFAELGKDKD